MSQQSVGRVKARRTNRDCRLAFAKALYDQLKEKRSNNYRWQSDVEIVLWEVLQCLDDLPD